MAAEVTLNIDEPLLKRAEDWAGAHGVSLSELVSDLIAGLPNDTEYRPLTEWTQRLVGAASIPGVEAPTDAELRASYVDHLTQKHR